MLKFVGQPFGERFEIFVRTGVEGNLQLQIQRRGLGRGVVVGCLLRGEKHPGAQVLGLVQVFFFAFMNHAQRHDDTDRRSALQSLIELPQPGLQLLAHPSLQRGLLLRWQHGAIGALLRDGRGR